MSMIASGPRGGVYGATGVQKNVVDGNTYYSGARGAAGPNGVAKGAQWVLVDANSDGTIDGGARQKGITNNDGKSAVRSAMFTPDGVRLTGSVVNGDMKKTWDKYL